MTRALVALCAACLACAALAAQGQIMNATIEERRARETLDREMAAIAAGGFSGWVGYRVPTIAGSGRHCWSPVRVDFEPPMEVLLFARFETGRLVRLRIFTPDCEVDAEGLRVIWLSGVKASDSVAWLKALALARPDDVSKRGRIRETAITALSLHDDPGATAVFEQILR